MNLKLVITLLVVMICLPMKQQIVSAQEASPLQNGYTPDFDELSVTYGALKLVDNNFAAGSLTLHTDTNGNGLKEWSYHLASESKFHTLFLQNHGTNFGWE